LKTDHAAGFEPWRLFLIMPGVPGLFSFVK
jgi:hypothetical protein